MNQFKENNWRSGISSAMQEIESIRPWARRHKGTVVKLFVAPSYKSASTFLQGNNFVMPPSQICIANLMNLGRALSPPRFGWFTGIVEHVSPNQSTPSKAEHKLDFTFVQNYFTWLQCCAMGINADSDFIAEGNRIVRFYDRGRPGMGSESAKIVFLEFDSTLVKVEKVLRIPCKLTDECYLNYLKQV